MKLGILILCPVKVVFVLVVRWEFWLLLLLQEMSGKTLYVGAWWLDRPGLLVSLWFSSSHLFLITVIFFGPVYPHFPSIRLCYQLQQKLRGYGKVGAVSIFPLSKYMSSQGIRPCPIQNCKYPPSIVFPRTTLPPLRQKQSHTCPVDFWQQTVWVVQGLFSGWMRTLLLIFKGPNSFQLTLSHVKILQDASNLLQTNATQRRFLQSVVFWWISEDHKPPVLKPNRPLGGN